MFGPHDQFYTPELRDALLPIARRVDALIDRHGIEAFRNRVEPWMAADFLAAESQRAWERRRDEFVKDNFVLMMKASVFDWDAPDRIEWAHIWNGPNGLHIQAIYPIELAKKNAPEWLRPIPIPDRREPTIEEKFVALSAVRDGLERGERVIPEVSEEVDRFWEKSGFRYGIMLATVAEFEPTDASKLGIWCNAVERELGREAAAPLAQAVPPDDLMAIDELAKLVHVTPKTLRNKKALGKPAIKGGGKGRKAKWHYLDVREAIGVAFSCSMPSLEEARKFLSQ